MNLSLAQVSRLAPLTPKAEVRDLRQPERAYTLRHSVFYERKNDFVAYPMITRITFI